VPAADLLADAAARFAAAATEAGVILKVKPVYGAPDVTVDPDRIHQALSNLIANALRHTPSSGQISLSAAAVADGVELAVADSGTGIDPADLPYVFDRFWRGDRARRRDGLGLGLPIARRLVEAHGGTIAVESEVGVGTTFTIWLPKKSNDE
jgi:signal transduction histidine kinase